MGFFPDTDILLQEFLIILLEDYGPYVALGAYILAVMAVGTITLTLAIMHQSIKIPVDLVKNFYSKKKGK